MASSSSDTLARRLATPAAAGPPAEAARTRPPLHLAQGLLMGAADIIPGVSGGTMALIVGVYARLITAIAEAATAAALVLRGRFGEAAARLRALEWGLVLPLAAGILAAIAVGSLFIPALLDRYPVQCRALFFGLVAASLAIPWRARRARTGAHLVAAALAAALAFGLTGLPRSPDLADPSLVRVFGSAAVAINAMILPGVSGAFLLEVLGLYRPTLEALRNLDLAYVLVFGAGCAVGLGLSSKLLGWLLAAHHDATMAVLVGLLAGSLRALWPWVGSVTHRHSDGSVSLVPDPSVLLPPDARWPAALALALAGFLFVTLLDWFGRRRVARAASPATHPAPPAA
ncbi:MAG: DUF368 domain-containing protein [Rubricoccaceae bacterium]